MTTRKDGEKRSYFQSFDATGIFPKAARGKLCALWCAMTALVFCAPTSSAKVIKLPSGLSQLFDNASKSVAGKSHPQGTREAASIVEFKTNIVVIPKGTNISVVRSGESISLVLTTNAAPNGTNLTTITTNLTVVANGSNGVPAGTNIVLLSNATNSVSLQPGTNFVVTTIQISGNNLQPTNLTAYIQIQSEAETASEFGINFAKAFFVGEVTVQNPYEKSLLVYSSSLKVDVKYVIGKSDLKSLSKEDKAKAEAGWLQFPRRPATFSDILAIFDYQEKKNWKQRTVDILKSAGQIAAGASVFVGGVNYSKGVAFVTGIISPELEKHLLWDLLLHAKNLESRSFKEIEEVPGFKPITKLVFFPRGGIPGIIPDLPVYLSYFEGAQDIEVRGAVLTSQEAVSSKPKGE
jgi:hypothetical protein